MDPAQSGADPVVVNNIIGQLKSRGIFDQFRRDCLADVDTKPAYQNLRQRVEGYVSNYLGQNKWEPGMNKNQLRDSLRRQINQSEMLATGVERIIEQVVEPKIQHIFRPKIEQLVKETLNPELAASTSTGINNANNNDVNNAVSLKTELVALPPEARPPEEPSIDAPPPPPPPEDEEEAIGGDDMDISTPSPTSSPDIRLSSPVDVSQVESPPPIPGVETDDAVDFDISQTISERTTMPNVECVELSVSVEMETSKSPSPDENKNRSPEIRIATSPEEVFAKMAAAASLFEQQQKVGVDSDESPASVGIVKQTEQLQITDYEKTAVTSKETTAPEDRSMVKLSDDKVISEIQMELDSGRLSGEEEDDRLVIAEDGSEVAPKAKRERGEDSDGESGLSDITVSSVHTSDLSSFDEEISSSSESEESESEESSESSFSDKFSDDSKKSGPRQKSPRKAHTSEPVEVSYRIVKLAHRGQGWFIDKYIYVKNRENTEKVFLRCQHKYLCKAIAYIEKATDKAYVKQGHHVHPPPDVRKITFGSDPTNKTSILAGHHVHPPPDVRKITFGSDPTNKTSILAVTKKPCEQEKSKKTNSSKQRKVAPIRLNLSKSPSPPSPAKEEETVSKTDDDFTKSEPPAATDKAPAATDKVPAATDKAPAATDKAPAATDKAPAATDKAPAATDKAPAATDKVPAATDKVPAATDKVPVLEKKDDERQVPVSATSLKALSPEARRLEEQRWAAYWEYSMAPSKRPSAKALALSRYHSDSEDEDAREERRKKAALDKEERARRRQERRERGSNVVTKEAKAVPQRSVETKDQKETKMETDSKDKEEDVVKVPPSKRQRRAADSPVKATKAQLKEQKILEKKREMRRQRSLNKRYFSDDFSSPVQENIKESLKVEEGSTNTAVESVPVTPIKRPVPSKIKPVVLSFHLRFRERRTPQVESHFLLCSCLSGEQQKKMSSRKQKKKSKIEGRQKSRFSFNAKVLEKIETKKQQPRKRGRQRKVEDDGKDSDISRSSTPVQDEIPPPLEMVAKEDTSGPKKRGRPRKVAVDDDKGGEQSRSSTPVQDEVPPMLDVMADDREIKEETGKRKRGRPRKNVEERQEGSSRSSTPVQEIASTSVDVISSGGQKKRGRPRKTPLEEKVDEEKVDKEKVDESSRSSTPVQDERVIEDMDVQGFTPVVVESLVVQGERPVEEMNIDVKPVEEMNIDVKHVDEMNIDVKPVEEMNINVKPVEETNIDVKPVEETNIDVKPVEEMNIDVNPVEEMVVAEELVPSPVITEEKCETDVAVTEEQPKTVTYPGEIQLETQEDVSGREDVSSKPESDDEKERDDKAEETKPMDAKDESTQDVNGSKKTELHDQVKQKEEEIKPQKAEEQDTRDQTLSEQEIRMEEKDVAEPAIEDVKQAESEIADFVSVEVAKNVEQISSQQKEVESMEVQELQKVEEKTEESKEEDKKDMEDQPVDEHPVQGTEQKEDTVSKLVEMDIEEGTSIADTVTKEKEDIQVEKVEKESSHAGEPLSANIQEGIPTLTVDTSPSVPDDLAVGNSPTAQDTAKESKTEDKIDSPEKNAKADGGVPRPVLGHSPTPVDTAKEDKGSEEVEPAKDAEVQQAKVTHEKLEESKGEESDRMDIPALGSSPTAKEDDEDDKEEVKETDNDTMKEEVVKNVESKKASAESKEDNLLVPALGHSPSQEQENSDESPSQEHGKTDEKDSKDGPPKIDAAQEVSDIDDNPPTPTQDEPSSMDEISPTEGVDGDDKPAIPIFTMSSPSKSPLGGLFTLGRSVSQEGPLAMQGSPGVARSQTGESSGTETNVDSEESAPSVTKEGRQRPKRRVSSPQDSDFEYSHPKRSRTETPPPPILEPELPIERPKEEEPKSRTTRASRQRHISPPHRYSPTPKESRVRTRHQSSQSTDNQQSVRTPSPSPPERVTRGRRSTRQSEEKQSHRYSDMVYYDTNRRSQRQQGASPSPVGNRRSSRRSTDDKSAERSARGKRKR